MLNASTVCDVVVKLKKSKAPLCESPSEVSRVEYKLESVLISAYCKTISTKVRAQEEFGPHSC